MLYITGDTHGEVKRFLQIAQEYSLTSEDTLIVAGDFGMIFGSAAKDNMKLDVLAALNYRILFIDGNHECFPRLYEYPVEEWNGGKIHRIRPNVIHLMRGQVFDIDGLSIFTMGGGLSIDQQFRVPGRSWWPEEMPSDEEYAEARANLQKHGNQVDVIISHAAPDETMEMFIQTGMFSNRFP